MGSDKEFNRDLVTWKTGCTWLPGKLNIWVPGTLDIWVPGTLDTSGCLGHHVSSSLKIRGLVVSSLLSPLFHMICMTLESDKMFHKLKTNLRRKIRTMLMRKGWSTLGRVFWKSVTPTRCNIYTVTA